MVSSVASTSVMKITLEQVSKRYTGNWVISDFNYVFESGKAYAVTGPNGSGKSTLLQLVSGHLMPTRGRLIYSENGQAVSQEELYRRFSFSAPYMQLVEEFTVGEMVRFHGRFKPLRPGIAAVDWLSRAGLHGEEGKEIRHLSSGMKQRLKAGLAVFSSTPLLVLDEPSTNLDGKGRDWLLEAIRENREGRIVIIATNTGDETSICEHSINLAVPVLK